jgi:hypothetical protein
VHVLNPRPTHPPAGFFFLDFVLVRLWAFLGKGGSKARYKKCRKNKSDPGPGPGPFFAPGLGLGPTHPPPRGSPIFFASLVLGCQVKGAREWQYHACYEGLMWLGLRKLRVCSPQGLASYSQGQAAAGPGLNLILSRSGLNHAMMIMCILCICRTTNA